MVLELTPEQRAFRTSLEAFAREVVAPGTPGLAAVAEAFGEDVLPADGSMDRPKLGSIVFAEWDFDGRGLFPDREHVGDGKATRVTLKRTHAFERPGTYFITARISSHPDGDPNDLVYRVPSLGRLRVVVT